MPARGGQPDLEEMPPSPQRGGPLAVGQGSGQLGQPRPNASHIAQDGPLGPGKEQGTQQDWPRTFVGVKGPGAALRVCRNHQEWV